MICIIIWYFSLILDRIAFAFSDWAISRFYFKHLLHVFSLNKSRILHHHLHVWFLHIAWSIIGCHKQAPKNTNESWEVMRNTFIEKYLHTCYRNHLIDKFERRFTLNIRTQYSKFEGYGHHVYECTLIKFFKCNKFWHYNYECPSI